MNKKIIAASLSIVVLIAIIIGVMIFLSYKDISLVFKQPNISVDIYSNSNDQKITSASANTTIRLQAGDYYYIPQNDLFDPYKNYFTVKDSETIEINPPFGSTFLYTLLQERKPAIHAALESSFPLISSSYQYGDEQLFDHGDWYSAKIVEIVQGNSEPDIYRIIAHREGSVWKVVVRPQLVISIAEYPQVPEYIIRQTNEPLNNDAQ